MTNPTELPNKHVDREFVTGLVGQQVAANLAELARPPHDPVQGFRDRGLPEIAPNVFSGFGGLVIIDFNTRTAGESL